MKEASVNGAKLAYTDVGPESGATVVLSHSLFFDHTMFAPLSERLVASGHRVIAYDQRGQGASSPGSRAELTVDNLAEDAAALITSLGLGRVHFAGNSLGGFVALRLAARHPELLRTVAAMGSSAEEEHSLAAFEPLAKQLTQTGAAPVVDVLMHIMFGDHTLANNAELTTPWRAFMAKLGPSIGDCALEVIYRKRIVEELAGGKVPVLAIAGSEDHAYPPPVSSENIANATGGKHVTVREAGHSVALEQPAIVSGLLLEHFARGT